MIRAYALRNGPYGEPVATDTSTGESMVQGPIDFGRTRLAIGNRAAAKHDEQTEPDNTGQQATSHAVLSTNSLRLSM